MKKTFFRHDHGLYSLSLSAMSPRFNKIHKRINERALLDDLIEKHRRPDGTVLVSESGMDCDCVSYSGRMHTIEASRAAYYELLDSLGEWADGPFTLQIVSEPESYQCRDLAMEAYEDGHPQVVYPTY